VYVDVNFRFAPDRSEEQAFEHVREVFAAELASGAVTAGSPTRRPVRCPLAHPAAAALVAAADGKFRAKYGWTDVSRFSALGIGGEPRARRSRVWRTESTSGCPSSRSRR
jgi:succinyl-diaminopimelate desuccinylase